MLSDERQIPSVYELYKAGIIRFFATSAAGFRRWDRVLNGDGSKRYGNDRQNSSRIFIHEIPPVTDKRNICTLKLLF
jgi:hypothetical protein